jgi:hypothetical protein
MSAVDSAIASASAPAAAPIGRWLAPAEDLAASLAAPVHCALDELGVIEVSGADAMSFLQAQLTNDTKGLDSSRVQFNGYCTAKGRLLAVFEQWREGDVICLQLPREILAPVMKKLSMFVLRAKARLEDASTRWTTQALIGPGAAQLLSQALGQAPAAGQSLCDGALRVTRLPDGGSARERFVLRAPAAQAERLQSVLAAARRVDGGVFWWSQIDAARPTVVAATQEAFVPQMINLEVLGGVNFKKGCYPGQEVVARSQYLGKLRRRMSIAHVDGTPEAATAGGDVFFDGQEQPSGKVVLAAAAPGGGMDLLLECPMDRIAEQTLLVGGQRLTLRPLPYELIDVTA